jgi:predicted PurR-regulated permease PerM
MGAATLSARAILRIVLIIVGVVLCLYLIYRLRRPITWIMIALFLAVALSPAVNFLNRYMRRGLAIAAVYLALLGAVVGLGLLLIPPIVGQVNKLADNAPHYAQDVQDYVNKNKRLRKLEKDYKITDKLNSEAAKLPSKLGNAAGVLKDIGFGLVNSLFALITILVLTAFMLGSGPRWREGFLNLQPPDRRQRFERILDRMSNAVSSYVIGAFTVSLIDGVAAFIVLTILGVPFSGPLAVLAGLLSLIPMVGATVAAVLIGIVTVFEDFPTTTIIWTVWAIVYQQLENNLIQPQIQKRTVNVHPFITIVAVLCGGTLLGVMGAIVAIPVAASIQILVREYVDLRTISLKGPEPPGPPGAPPPPPEPVPA